MRADIQAKLGAPKIGCRIVDISTSGAKISVANGDVPDNFVLHFNSAGTVIRICRVVWREGSAIGVEFTMPNRKRTL